MSSQPPSDLQAACSELSSWLAIAETLMAEPDIQPAARRSHASGSRPPWNPAVANAVFDTHAGVRQLEGDLHLAVAGHARPRGGSSQNTQAALEAIPAMEVAAGDQRAQEAVRKLTRLALAIRQLPAIDDAARWVKLRPGPDGLPPRCPFCQTFSLRVAVESLTIACWYPGCWADEEKTRRHSAQLQISRVQGIPVLVWETGLVQ